MESPICFPMNPSEYFKAFNVSKKVTQKIIAQSFFFLFVETKALDKVILGQIKNPKPHCTACLI